MPARSPEPQTTRRRFRRACKRRVCRPCGQPSTRRGEPIMKSRLLLCCTALWLWQTAARAENLPSFSQVRASHIASDALLVDRRGEPLADLRLDMHGRRLQWTPLSALSPAMRDALLRAEDRRFFQHKGVDWLAFAGAAWQNLWGDTTRGASTLTMQLAGLLDPELRLPKDHGGRRSLSQKWDQGVAALALEEQWSKAQILEAYLNLAPFRGDLQGITAASELLFGVRPAVLDVTQASLLAALLRGPNARPGVVARRACVLAEGMGQKRLCPQITRLASTRLDAPRNQPRHGLAPHLARLSLKHPGEARTSLIDAMLQVRLLGLLQAQHDPGAAALVLDNASGEVLAWIGALDPALPDGVSRGRLLADWWAPAAAALALEQRWASPATPLPRGWLPWLAEPQPERDFEANWLSLRAALELHDSAALLQLRQRNGHEAWLARLQRLGFAPAGEADAPGTVNLLQLAALWRSFASLDHRPAQVFPGLAGISATSVWPAAPAWLIRQLLGDYSLWEARGLEGGAPVLVGIAGPYTLVFAPARAEDARQRWLTLAQCIAAPATPTPPPEGIEQALVSFEPPQEAARREYFITGTAPDMVSVLPGLRRARIDFPEADAHYVLPSDAPIAPWSFAAEGAVALHWRLDGQALSSGRLLSWPPQAGRHALEILGPDGELLDSMEFEISLQP
ncbi:MAG: hypothetical protein CGU29_04780 [Candidatus Dactylopiibacterium carminicum]|uniref:peptidoglycan glycosyltransferase n=2 Tax=Candidatus Dactylopiibacterium carminicum TaxID=857335 RepID=A0A272EVS0_9RHOO|nr:hypothetical protein BGI27_05565 [Candidatus Dactylopiibacterium carminicum]PAS94146.1 MAG: hypothetical protein CGU29_04780 [Candidatus Dactylopiibacterium carminicum]